MMRTIITKSSYGDPTFEKDVDKLIKYVTDRRAKVCTMCDKKLDDYADARGFKRKE